LFPVSVEGRHVVGPLSSAQAKLVIDDLAEWLTMLGADDVLLERRVVSFRAGNRLLAGNWNPLLPFDKGTITVTPGAPGTVAYQLSTVRGLALVTAGVVVLTTLFAFVAGEGSNPLLVAKLMVMGWLWLFGVNYLIAWARISRYIKLGALARSGPA